MRTLAQRSLKAGFDVMRLNVRNCGGTEHLAPTLYHSGLTADLRSVVEQLAPAPLFLIGFSMGGNMVLKLASEWSEQPPAHVRAVCGISVPIRLEACARRLAARSNRVYEARFLRELTATLRRKRQRMPELFENFPRNGFRSIYEFDDLVTAPAFGFRGAAHYYECASCGPLLDKVRVPALLIQAEDDPFIPFETYQDSVFERNSFLRLMATSCGGHVAFLARTGPRFWAVERAVGFFDALRAAEEIPHARSM
jgi:predicted alpha/beta-fold hydrolase